MWLDLDIYPIQHLIDKCNVIDLLSNACEFSSLEFSLGKYTIVNLCSMFNLINTLFIVSFLNSVPLSVKMNLDGPICGKHV